VTYILECLEFHFQVNVSEMIYWCNSTWYTILISSGLNTSKTTVVCVTTARQIEIPHRNYAHFVSPNFSKYWAVIAQSVERLATGLDGPGIESRWEAIFSAPFQTGHWDLPSLLYNGYRVSFLVVKRPGRGVDHAPTLAPMLKQEYSYTSTPHVGLRGLF